MSADDLGRDWMPDEPEEPTPEVIEAAKVPPEPIPAAADLPDDVRDGDLSDEQEV